MPRPMGIDEVGRRCLEAMGRVLRKKPESLIGVSKEAKGWRGVVEVLERRSVPDSQDLMGRYEVLLSEDGELLGYKQLLLKLRVPPYGVSEVYGEETPAKEK